MNIAVLVKASLDPNMVRADATGRILIDEMPLAISEYDRNAVEEAVRIKEKHGGRVVAFSVLTWGPVDRRAREAEQVMREALAMGADEAHLVVDESIVPGHPAVTARVLASLIRRTGRFDLVLTGEASMDALSSQIAARLGEELGMNVVTYVRRLSVSDGSLVATRDLEEELEVVEVPLPAVVSVTGEINRPRLPTLLQIRRAFAKPLKKYRVSDLGLEIPRPAVVREDIRLLAVARKNVIVEGDSLEEVAEKLVEALRQEGILG